MKNSIIYVSNNGKDKNNGTISSPLLTLQEAVNKADKNGCTIYVRGGRYHFSETLEIINKKNITVKPYENEKVYLDGGKVIPNERIKKLSDENIKNKIINKEVLNDVYEADLSGLGIEFEKYTNIGFDRCTKASPTELFINAEPQSVVMYPKKDSAPYPLKTVFSGSAPSKCDFDIKKPVIAFSEDRCSLWKNAKEASVTGIFCWSYAHDTIGIEKIDTENKTITLNSPHYFGITDKNFCHWRVLNILEEMSEKGEYYIDCENQKLYFIPSIDISDALIEVSSLGEPMIAMENSENITIDGFVIENSRYSAVYIEGGENCLVKNCTIRNIGTIGVQFGKGFQSYEDGTISESCPPEEKKPVLQKRKLGAFQVNLYHYAAMESEAGKNNGIDSCELYGIGSGGVILNGGKRKTLENAGNYVTNCKIYNANRLDKTYKAGIHVLGCGNRIANCEIFDMPGFAIYLHGNNHIIEYNNVYDSVKEVTDAGAFYMGRDVSEVGNILRYNYFHHLKPAFNTSMGICAMYFDDYAVFNQVRGNYFSNIEDMKFGAVFWNRGCDTSVSNNVFFDCKLPLRPHFYCAKGVRKQLLSKESVLYRRAFADKDDFKGVDITSEVYKKAYPYLYALYTGDYSAGSNVWSNTIISDKEKLFVDYKNNDFTLSDECGVFKYAQPEVYDTVLGIEDGEIWFEKIDFKKIGIQN